MRFILSLVLSCLVLSLFSQASDDNTTARAEFILRFTKTKYLSWPRSSRKDFDITILKDSSLYNGLIRVVPKKTMFGRNIHVNIVPTITLIPKGSDLIYMNSEDGFNMQSILRTYSGQPVLIVGENYPYHTCMINLVTLNGNTVYEINEELLNAQGLKPLDPLIKGQAKDELEWKKSFDQAQKLLENEKRQLSIANKRLNEAQQTIQQKETELIATDSALQITADTLEQTKEDLERKKEIISVQQHEAEMKEAEMSNQKRINLFIIIVLVLVLSLLFVIYRNFRNSKKANEQLHQLNKQLKKHKDDIYYQKQTIEFKNAEISDSIHYARRIQDALMPEADDFSKIFSESFIFFKPKDIVSGDFFWYHELPDAVLVAVVDCTGHGVPGAMMSVVGLKLLQEAVNEKMLFHPQEILHYIDTGVYTAFKANTNVKMKDGMDLSICRIDKTTGKLEFAGVYNPVYIVNTFGLRELKPDKKPIGAFQKDYRYSSQHVELSKGDSIYLFSDGYADQFGGPKGKKFKYSAFRDLLKKIQTESSENQKKKLQEVFQKWKGDLEQVDDICILGIKI